MFPSYVLISDLESVNNATFDAKDVIRLVIHCEYCNQKILPSLRHRHYLQCDMYNVNLQKKSATYSYKYDLQGKLKKQKEILYFLKILVIEK